jgi:hypothetical protein
MGGFYQNNTNLIVEGVGAVLRKRVLVHEFGACSVMVCKEVKMIPESASNRLSGNPLTTAYPWYS